MTQIRGRYFDGKSARANEATVRPQAGELWIRGTEGAVLARWPLREIEQTGDGRGPGPFALSCRAEPEARLLIADRTGLEMLHRLAPEMALAERSRRFKGLRSVLLGTLAAMLAVVVVFEFSPRWLGRAIPSSWLAPVGAAYIEGLSAQHRLCTDPGGRGALERLAQRLAAARGHDGAIIVDILDWGELNAFALPGDRIVVLSGLIRKVGPDELAGVLAHEVAHVTERHVNENLVRALGASLLIQLVTGGGAGSDPATVAAMLGQLAYSRAAEAEADRAAVEALQSEGLRASGLHSFFARLSQEPGAGLIPAWLSTHPASAKRAAATPDENTGGKDPFTAEDWRLIQAVCS